MLVYPLSSLQEGSCRSFDLTYRQNIRFSFLENEKPPYPLWGKEVHFIP